MKKLLVFLCTIFLVFSTTEMAGATYITELESNNSFALAQNLDGAFSLDVDSNIFSSTTYLHASVDATNASKEDVDYFSFTVSQAGISGFFDIDNGSKQHQPVDTIMGLFDSNYYIRAYNDDSAPDPDLDPGSKSEYDSFIGVYTFPVSGTYYLAVTSWRDYVINCNSCDLFRPDGVWGGSSLTDYGPLDMNAVGGTDNNGKYILHVSLSSPVPEPATMLLVGFGLVGLAGIGRKKFYKE